MYAFVNIFNLPEFVCFAINIFILVQRKKLLVLCSCSHCQRKYILFLGLRSYYGHRSKPGTFILCLLKIE